MLDFQPIYYFEMLISGNQTKIMLKCKRGDPNIIFRNGAAFLAKLHFQFPVIKSCIAITTNDVVKRDEFFDSFQVFLHAIRFARSII